MNSGTLKILFGKFGKIVLTLKNYFINTYQNKTVIITGHTGFQGAWLCEWLLSQGAKVIGYSIDIPTEPSLFEALNLSKRIHQDVRADIQDKSLLQEIVVKIQPDFIFHLAAQPIVRDSFKMPYETFSTNFIGTLNLLEILKKKKLGCVLIIATTDKVYKNREWIYPYRENDALGGNDPYSGSKACVELLLKSYQKSFFIETYQNKAPIAVASVRGGNVIGGGDWSPDRIVPDCIRSLQEEESILIRNQFSTRPWQHVLDLLCAYLELGSCLYKTILKEDTKRLNDLCTPFNIGPSTTSNKTVKELVKEILKYWQGDFYTQKEAKKKELKHESHKLNISYDKAFHVFGWRPVLNFEESVKNTVKWYLKYHETKKQNQKLNQSIIEYSQEEIKKYITVLESKK